MVKLIRAAVVIFILAVPPYVEATCAWVLWGQGVSNIMLFEKLSVSSWWEFRSAHTDKGQCEKESAEQMKRLMSIEPTAGTKIEAKGNLFETKTYTASGEFASSRTLRLICVPDTIDPRGPKGAGR